MAVATANAHAPTRREGAPVATVHLGGRMTGTQAVQVSVRVRFGIKFKALFGWLKIGISVTNHGMLLVVDTCSVWHGDKICLRIVAVTN